MADCVWDERKREFNIRKHGVDFLDIAGFIDDPGIVWKEDRRRDYGEARIQSIARVGDELLFIVYTARGEKLRLISARRANREERRMHEEKASRP